MKFTQLLLEQLNLVTALEFFEAQGNKYVKFNETYKSPLMIFGNNYNDNKPTNLMKYSTFQNIVLNPNKYKNTYKDSDSLRIMSKVLLAIKELIKNFSEINNSKDALLFISKNFFKQKQPHDIDIRNGFVKFDTSEIQK